MSTYFIASDSLSLINNEINNIINDSNSLIVRYDLRKDILKDALNEAYYSSFIDEEKYLIIKCGDFKKLEESDIILLENYLNNQNDKCTIIITSYVLPDKRKKIYKLLNEKSKIILFPTLNKKELVYKCIELLKENGFKVDYETANYIVENSYVNYDIMLNELSKIYLLIKEKYLNIDKIKDIISLSLNDNIFTYINAVTNKDLEKAFVYSKNFEKLKVEPISILITLYKEFQILLMLKSNVNEIDIKNLFHKEDWQMQNYFSKLNLYTKNELEKIISKLHDYDVKIKKGLIDKSVIIDLILFDLCV